MKTVKITCQGADVLDINQLTTFQGTLKELSKANYKKLRKAIEDFGFSFPVFVWRNSGNFNILDGHQRILTLQTMQNEGWEIPPIPVVWIDAIDEKEAKTKLLLAVGQYGKLSDESLYEYLKTAELEIPGLSDLMELPGIDFAKYQAKFGFDDVSEQAAPELKSGDREPYQQMTFVLHDSQTETVKKALAKARKSGGHESEVNENTNGNAIAFICQEFIRGQS